MRTAAIYDIHGNLPALESVLDDIHSAHVDQVIVGGDVVPGPMPRETLGALLELDIPVQFIHGNGDREVIATRTGKETSAVPERFREVTRWNAQQLLPEDERLLASWPLTRRLEIPGIGQVLFCHATPRKDTDVFTRFTSEDLLGPIFEGLNVRLVICGHTHMQFDRTIAKLRVVNAGSVGMPFGKPGAYWLLLGPDDIQLRHTSYNLKKAAERIRNTSYPQADDFATNNVLQPPSEREMLELFSKSELE